MLDKLYVVDNSDMPLIITTVCSITLPINRYSDWLLHCWGNSVLIQTINKQESVVLQVDQYVVIYMSTFQYPFQPQSHWAQTLVAQVNVFQSA